MRLSVIICSHNPRPSYLQATLDGLKIQTLGRDKWELLVIDNGSYTPLRKLIDLSWHPHGRIIDEPEMGLTPARLRGIKESEGEYLLFVDDDNILQRDYASIVLRLAEQNPTLGCFGAGIIEPRFEDQPDAELEPYLESLALRRIKKSLWSNHPQDSVIPWGAGLVVSRAVAQLYAQSVIDEPLKRKLDRSGASLISCGDDEFTWVACEAGYGKGIFTELSLIHLIASHRVTKEYLLRLAEAQAMSRVMLAHIHQVYPPTYVYRSTLVDVAKSLVKCNVSAFLDHANTWWSSRKIPATQRQFEEAVRRGTKAGLAGLQKQSRAEDAVPSPESAMAARANN
jgi:glycosyltransferase involved in cell wall biosynthesis